MWARLILVVAAASAACACSSAETSVTSPSPAGSRCQISASATTTTFNAGGGSGTIDVTTARDCSWTVTTDAGWMSIAGNRGGQGDGTISFSVATNPVPAPRSGAIAVADQQVAVRQDGAPCRFSLSRSADSIGYGGGRLTVDVSTLTGCSWTASASQSWMAITSGQSGNANGTVGLSIAANSGARRVGELHVGGQIYTVTQDAAPAPPAPAPTPAPPSPAPAPPPAPKPPPSPIPSKDVHLDGTALFVSGACPDISFFVDGRRVEANGQTQFKGKCNDLNGGDHVVVDGKDNGDVVTATKIELKKKKDDDD